MHSGTVCIAFGSNEGIISLMVENSIHEKAMLLINGEQSEFVSKIEEIIAISNLVGKQTEMGNCVMQSFLLGELCLKPDVAKQLYPDLGLDQALKNTGSVRTNFNSRVKPHGLKIGQEHSPTTYFYELIEPADKVKKKIREKPTEHILSMQMIAGVSVPLIRDHNHHWVIAEANGPVSDGRCKGCGEHRVYRNSLSEEQINPNRNFNRHSRRD